MITIYVDILEVCNGIKYRVMRIMYLPPTHIALALTCGLFICIHYVGMKSKKSLGIVAISWVLFR